MSGSSAISLECPDCAQTVALLMWPNGLTAVDGNGWVRCAPSPLEYHLNAVVEELAIVQHNAYEEAAVNAGWSTNIRSRRPWEQVPEENKVTMRESIKALLAQLVQM